uniref:F-box domain-containing protein n=1 Tax=Eutreptiella gymnastica TaxID=73025 RepID=A0A7S1NMM3_9EUGL
MGLLRTAWGKFLRWLRRVLWRRMLTKRHIVEYCDICLALVWKSGRLECHNCAALCCQKCSREPLDFERCNHQQLRICKLCNSKLNRLRFGEPASGKRKCGPNPATRMPLPGELLQTVMEFTDTSDTLCRLQLVCRGWYETVQDLDVVWRAHLLQKWHISNRHSYSTFRDAAMAVGRYMDDKGQPSLCSASARGDGDAVGLLLHNDWHMQQAREPGQLPPWTADRQGSVCDCRHHKGPQDFAAERGHVYVLGLLLSHGYHKQYPQGHKSPLHYTCMHGHYGAAQLLIQSLSPGPQQLDVADEQGLTPLDHAIRCDHPRLVELLVRSGAQSCCQATVDCKVDNSKWYTLLFAVLQGLPDLLASCFQTADLDAIHFIVRCCGATRISSLIAREDLHEHAMQLLGNASRLEPSLHELKGYLQFSSTKCGPYIEQTLFLLSPR